MSGRTPEELESLLEDAVVLRDGPAVADLFEPTGVLVTGAHVARGVPQLTREARRLWSGGEGYLADGRRLIRAGDLSLVVGTRSITVGHRSADGLWRYAFAVFARAGTEEEPTVHTVVVRMSADPSRREDVVRHLLHDIVPWATSRPGFVSGQWMLSSDGRGGGGVISFDSFEAAEQAAEGPRRYPHDGSRAWNIDSVEVFEQVAAADRAVPTAGAPADR